MGNLACSKWGCETEECWAKVWKGTTNLARLVRVDCRNEGSPKIFTTSGG
jgi:hypothetical protein